jgi:hypothetical protein
MADVADEPLGAEPLFDSSMAGDAGGDAAAALPTDLATLKMAKLPSQVRPVPVPGRRAARIRAMVDARKERLHAHALTHAKAGLGSEGA